MHLNIPTTQVEPEPRDFEHHVRQFQPLRCVLATLRERADELAVRHEAERRHGRDAAAAPAPAESALIDGVLVPAPLVPAAAYMRRRGIRGAGLDAAVLYLSLHGSAAGCPQLILESDADAVESLLPESIAWASRQWDRPAVALAEG